jgi:hypothetical protein
VAVAAAEPCLLLGKEKEVVVGFGSRGWLREGDGAAAAAMVDGMARRGVWMDGCWGWLLMLTAVVVAAAGRTKD